MDFKINKTLFLLIVFLIIFFNVTKSNNVNRIYFNDNIFIQSFSLNKKSNLRKLIDWEEEVIFSREGMDDDEKDSIEHCKKSYYTDYKYNIFYEVGKEFTDLENQDSNLYNLIDKNNYYPVSNIF